ncbi:unnamed protein product (macronuclear) [Paramecium tetraurelia]|uniref:Transmembrane protein n=1 Tax=Paramecium tetraurelia TaxID=5888 RepID=A0C7U7_PARTE|nr:uncharacterized protein GSPATT00035995001 [Paramecium tetraurelia]CAK66864.1 unnamed protein product [Paramecium tetraurelia]|eukprot:XP_001434261.1 hypothetical protein (macronuclear) [Paramecium tetraurelia strain d4-2]
MIKTYSLQFGSQEIEQMYRQSPQVGFKHRSEYLYAAITIYLILIVIKYNQYQNLMLQLFPGVGLILILICYIGIRRYQKYKEIFVTTNMLIMSAIIESIRLFGSESDSWFYGHHSSVLKILIYSSGSSFIGQSCFFLLTQIANFYDFQTYDIQSIISQFIISIMLVVLRYQHEIIKRKHFLVNLSKVQYDNILEDLLPSWVVIVKYNKLTGLLDIEKINKHLKDKFNINNSEAFREFLRKLVFFDMENQNTQQYIKIEHQIIQELQQKNEEHPDQKYFAILEEQNKSKLWKFRVTQVYFNSFQPQILLLFEEIEEDKYDKYINAIEQRDKQLYLNAKLSIKQINHQLEIIQQFYQEVSKHECLIYIQHNLKQQLQLNYFLYNLNNNLFNLYQICHRQIKSDINVLKLDLFIIDVCLNLQIEYKINKQNQHLNLKNLIVTTDKQKLISIIMNLVYFIKLLLSIIHKDNNIVYQVQPLKKPIKLSIKQSKKFQNSLQISLTHPDLNVANSLITQLQHIEPFQLDDQKRNWEQRNYFDKITSINENLQQIMEMHKQEVSSNQLIQIDNPQINSKNQQGIQNVKQLQFNTMGYIIAQYFASSLGPHNKFTFKQTCLDIERYHSTQFIGLQQTKIQFCIYKNFQNFQKEIQSEQQYYFGYNLNISSEKMIGQDIYQNSYQQVQKTK